MKNGPVARVSSVNGYSSTNEHNIALLMDNKLDIFHHPNSNTNVQDIIQSLGPFDW